MKQEGNKGQEPFSPCFYQGIPEERRLGYMFRQIQRAFHQAYNKKLECHNLTSTQSEVLSFLAGVKEQQATQKEIEYYLNLKNPTVTGILNRLEEKNYVKRTRNPKDKRSHVVVLTDESREILMDMWRDAVEMDAKLTENLTEEDRRRLIGYLEIVLNNIS